MNDAQLLRAEQLLHNHGTRKVAELMGLNPSTIWSNFRYGINPDDRGDLSKLTEWCMVLRTNAKGGRKCFHYSEACERLRKARVNERRYGAVVATGLKPCPGCWKRTEDPIKGEE